MDQAGTAGKLHGLLVVSGSAISLAACSGSSDSSQSVLIEGTPPIAFVERTVNVAGNPTDALFNNGNGDPFIREVSSPSAAETNITHDYTHDSNGSWTVDVSDQQVAHDSDARVFDWK